MKTLEESKRIELPELRALAKEHKIKGMSLMNKPEIIAVFVEKGILPEELLLKPVKVEKEIVKRIKLKRK